MSRKSGIRILVVDDSDLWREFSVSTLEAQPEFQVIGEAADGLEAVHRAETGLNPSRYWPSQVERNRS
jgi:DNA-binding NarL/FixJ family response regulator